jgi:hypothetical protein
MIRYRAHVFGVLLLLQLRLFTPAGCSRNNGAAVRAEGVAIVSAIAKYQKANGGSYPPSLSSLVPKYLASPPVYNWQYSVHQSPISGGFFSLTDGEGGWSVHHYDSASGKWASSQPAD